jgi:ABC-type transport system involved in cytochrome c biogenesis permease subunit
MPGNSFIQIGPINIPRGPWIWIFLALVAIGILIMRERIFLLLTILAIVIFLILVIVTIQAYSENSSSREGFLVATIVCLIAVLFVALLAVIEGRSKEVPTVPKPTQTSPAIKQTPPVLSNQTKP